MPDLLDRLKTALADRYAIEREIGAGGMADSMWLPTENPGEPIYLSRFVATGVRILASDFSHAGVDVGKTDLAYYRRYLILQRIGLRSTAVDERE